MNSFAVVAFFAALAAANAGHLYGHSAQILQGPSSRTTLVGPEGSVISAVAPGGQIIHEENPGYLAHSAPLVAHSAYAVPVAHAYASHGLVAHAAPIHHGLADTIVAGPSGTIVANSGSHGALVSGHHGLPLAYGAQVIVPHGHGLEGQYVHDYTETLYDDGSYKHY